MSSPLYRIQFAPNGNVWVQSPKTGTTLEVPVTFNENCDPVSRLPVGDTRKGMADSLVGRMVYAIQDGTPAIHLTRNEALMVVALDQFQAE
jgi:hypothetical protein